MQFNSRDLLRIGYRTISAPFDRLRDAGFESLSRLRNSSLDGAFRIVGLFALILAVPLAMSLGCGCPQVETGTSDVGIHPIQNGSLDLKQTMAEHKNGVTAVAFSPDGKWALSGEAGNEVGGNCLLVLWELNGDGGMESKFQDRFVHSGGVSTVAFSPDGNWALTGGVDGDRETGWRGSLVLWKLDNRGNMIQQGEAHREWKHVPIAASFSRDGRWALSAGGNTAPAGEEESNKDEKAGGSLHLWKLDGKGGMSKENSTYVGGIATMGIAHTPSGRWAVTSTLDDGKGSGRLILWELDGEGRVTQRQVIHNAFYGALAFSPDGSWLLSEQVLWRFVDRSGTIEKCYTAITGTGTVSCLAFGPDSRWAIVGGPGRGHNGGTSIEVWELDGKGGMRKHSSTPVRLDDDINAVAISPDGRWALTGGKQRSSEDGVLRLWRLE